MQKTSFDFKLLFKRTQVSMYSNSPRSKSKKKTIGSRFSKGKYLGNLSY